MRIQTALLIADDAAFRAALQGALRRRGVAAHIAATSDHGLAVLDDAAVDLVVVDHGGPPAMD